MTYVPAPPVSRYEAELMIPVANVAGRYRDALAAAGLKITSDRAMDEDRAFSARGAVAPAWLPIRPRAEVRIYEEEGGSFVTIAFYQDFVGLALTIPALAAAATLLVIVAAPLAIFALLAACWVPITACRGVRTLDDGLRAQLARRGLLPGQAR